MSDLKRPRLGRCLICGQKKPIQQHGKCYDCRVQMMMCRYVGKGKLHKFRTPQ